MAVYNHSKVLFVNEDGSAMRFRMRPCSERAGIAPMIEHGGGIITNRGSEGDIVLVPDDERGTSAESLSHHYIVDCVEKNKLLSLDDYRKNDTNDSSTSSDFDIEAMDDLQPAYKMRVEAKGIQGRRKYYVSEDVNIIKFLVDEGEYQNVTSTLPWKKMETLEVTPHSWQSMMDRFKKIIKPGIRNYNLPNHYISLFTGSAADAATSKQRPSSVTTRSVTKGPVSNAKLGGSKAESQGPVSDAKVGGSKAESKGPVSDAKVGGSKAAPLEVCRAGTADNEDTDDDDDGLMEVEIDNDISEDEFDHSLLQTATANTKEKTIRSDSASPTRTASSPSKQKSPISSSAAASPRKSARMQQSHATEKHNEASNGVRKSSKKQSPQKPPQKAGEAKDRTSDKVRESPKKPTQKEEKGKNKITDHFRESPRKEKRLQNQSDGESTGKSSNKKSAAGASISPSRKTGESTGKSSNQKSAAGASISPSRKTGESTGKSSNQKSAAGASISPSRKTAESTRKSSNQKSAAGASASPSRRTAERPSPHKQATGKSQLKKGVSQQEKDPSVVVSSDEYKNNDKQCLGSAVDDSGVSEHLRRSTRNRDDKDVAAETAARKEGGRKEEKDSPSKIKSSSRKRGRSGKLKQGGEISAVSEGDSEEDIFTPTPPKKTRLPQDQDEQDTEISTEKEGISTREGSRNKGLSRFVQSPTEEDSQESQSGSERSHETRKHVHGSCMDEIKKLMRDYELTMNEVRYILMMHSGNVANAKEWIETGSISSGVIWESEDDLILKGTDTKAHHTLQKKYGQKAMCKRLLFLEDLK